MNIRDAYLVFAIAFVATFSSGCGTLKDSAIAASANESVIDFSRKLVGLRRLSLESPIYPSVQSGDADLRAESFVLEIGRDKGNQTNGYALDPLMVNDYRYICEKKGGKLERTKASFEGLHYVYCKNSDDDFIFGFYIRKTSLSPSSRGCGQGLDLYLVSGVAFDPVRPIKVGRFIEKIKSDLVLLERVAPAQWACGSALSASYFEWRIASPREREMEISQRSEVTRYVTKENIEEKTAGRDEKIIGRVSKIYHKLGETRTASAYVKVKNIYSEKGMLVSLFLLDYSAPQKAPNGKYFRSHEESASYDCRQWTKSPISVCWYSGPMKSGSVVDSIEGFPFPKIFKLDSDDPVISYACSQLLSNRQMQNSERPRQQ